LVFNTLKNLFIDFTKDVFETSKRQVFLRAIRLFKLYVSNSSEVGFFDAQDAENEFEWTLEILNHRFIDLTKVVFETSRRQIIIYQHYSLT
jgi:hypothetical protein